MEFVVGVIRESWEILADSSVYIIFGLLTAGLLRVFLSPAVAAGHLRRGRYLSVIKAALLGIPMPLCSCGVLPAALSLKKQGANNGAVSAFLISTPESGVDSIAATYALMDPVMTVARPVCAFAAAVSAGFAENALFGGEGRVLEEPDLTCPVDACCTGEDCPPEIHARHHGPGEKLVAGMRFAAGELWGDLAGWFFIGLILAGLITVLVPEEIIVEHLAGGLVSMLLMLAAGIPMYICATASTPIAAALVLKGVSPGAALVFLLAGPATNITSLTVLLGVLGKRGTAVYLAAIAVSAVAAGLILDQVYAVFDLSARAMTGRAADLVPGWTKIAGAVFLLALSIRPLWRKLTRVLTRSGAPRCGPSCVCPNSEPGPEDKDKPSCSHGHESGAGHEH